MRDLSEYSDETLESLVQFATCTNSILVFYGIYDAEKWLEEIKAEQERRVKLDLSKKMLLMPFTWWADFLWVLPKPESHPIENGESPVPIIGDYIDGGGYEYNPPTPTTGIIKLDTQTFPDGSVNGQDKSIEVSGVLLDANSITVKNQISSRYDTIKYEDIPAAREPRYPELINLLDQYGDRVKVLDFDNMTVTFTDPDLFTDKLDEELNNLYQNQTIWGWYHTATHTKKRFRERHHYGFTLNGLNWEEFVEYVREAKRAVQ